jgi:hypothetical protein
LDLKRPTNTLPSSLLGLISRAALGPCLSGRSRLLLLLLLRDAATPLVNSTVFKISSRSSRKDSMGKAHISGMR